jgi:hypothetical protein
MFSPWDIPNVAGTTCSLRHYSKVHFDTHRCGPTDCGVLENFKPKHLLYLSFPSAPCETSTSTSVFHTMLAWDHTQLESIPEDFFSPGHTPKEAGITPGVLGFPLNPSEYVLSPKSTTAMPTGRGEPSQLPVFVFFLPVQLPLYSILSLPF